MQVYVTIRMDDAFILNYHPTVPVGYKEQVIDAKCIRPFLPLVKGLAPRLNERRKAPRISRGLLSMQATKLQAKRETRSVLHHSLVVDSTEQGC